MKVQRSSALIKQLLMSVESEHSSFALLASLINASVYDMEMRGLIYGALNFLPL